MKRAAAIGTVTVILLLAVMTVRYGNLFPPLGEAKSFHRPSMAEFARTREAFGAEFAGESGGTLLEELAFASSTSTDFESTRVFSEPNDECTGRGTYLVRIATTETPALFTAPHRGSDLLTGNLAAILYGETKAAGAAWNSAPRRQTSECEAYGDLAAEPGHWFTAFVLAYADTYPDARVVQLHGFDGVKRGSERLQSASVILSDGTQDPGARLLDLSECLSIALHPREVRVFPIDAEELGALRNAQGIALRKAGFGGFTHIEMSLPLRRELLSEEELRARFGQCFAR